MISKEKVPFHPRPVFPPMVTVAKGKLDQKCSRGAAHAHHRAQGMRSHIPLKLVAKPFGENLCRKARLHRQGVLIGDGLRVSPEARERCSNVNSFALTLHPYWWKGSPVLDVCKLCNTLVLYSSCLSGRAKEIHSQHEVF